MLGIVISLIISWIILYWIEGKSILALGILPITKRTKQLIIGFIITATLCFIVEFLEFFLRGSTLSFNENFSLGMLGGMFWWDLKSVITEELIFRGAILFILIKNFGEKKALLFSASAFGCYHWFSFGIIGNIFPMIIVFIGTGLMGYAWALAFSKTRSIFMPIGLHLGWNFTFNTIFSKGPLGEGVLIAENGHGISDWYSLVGLWIVPLVVFLMIKFWVRTKDTISESGIEMKTMN